MISISKIAVIGGTGKSGQYLTRELIRQEIPFRILLRNPQRLISRARWQPSCRAMPEMAMLYCGCYKVAMP
ncbi:NmrA family NAD(P)-binding protein [Niabella yanshanensis]|uniref:NmrA family NAD(P)-binding protein n=1 Tax=Niabella yanshanensis TaxID=577386 RepID=A0ABZ0W8L3_9BACT|nr:NmrA family NAD(P)-binding protein [Niabella yanshanensis]WQD39620.1 NmrA family NAD(P)-binding protein [Niabella yanshanensis]